MWGRTRGCAESPDELTIVTYPWRGVPGPVWERVTAGGHKPESAL